MCVLYIVNVFNVIIQNMDKSELETHTPEETPIERDLYRWVEASPEEQYGPINFKLVVENFTESEVRWFLKRPLDDLDHIIFNIIADVANAFQQGEIVAGSSRIEKIFGLADTSFVKKQSERILEDLSTKIDITDLYSRLKVYFSMYLQGGKDEETEPTTKNLSPDEFVTLFYTRFGMNKLETHIRDMVFGILVPLMNQVYFGYLKYKGI